MNTVSRGIRNAFRNVIRTGSIVIILSLSVGLVIAMLAARQAVTEKINAVKSNTGNTISVSPAGMRGFEGGGTALTTTQVSKISSINHVTKVVSTLSDRLTSSKTSLESGIEMGALGQRFNNSSSGSSSSSSSSSAPTPPSGSDSSSSSNPQEMGSSITIYGITDASSIKSQGSSSITWKSGSMFDGNKDQAVAVIGSKIASKNNLSIGSTFTAYGTTFKVVGIYDSGNTFNNNGVYIPLSTLQRLSGQTNSITSVAVTVDSSDNLSSATTAIKNILGSSADVTNAADTAEATTKPLESVSSIALFSLIGAIVAGAIIILLTMLMIVRERRREIGVMKAIGASNLKIMWQFIVESTTLTILALIVGTGIGVAAAAPLTTALVDNSSMTTTTSSQQGPGGMGDGMRGFGRASQKAAENITASVGATTIAYGIGAALLIAVLGSAIPSLMISKIKPADAMRNE